MAQRTPENPDEVVHLVTTKEMDRDTEELVAAWRRRDVIEAGYDPDTPKAQAWIHRGFKLYKPPRETRNHPIVNPEPASVYRAYDKEGNLLYVGITARGVKRAGQHSYRSKWWTEMVRQEWEHFATKQEALHREAHLIATEHPIHNVAGVRSSRGA